MKTFIILVVAIAIASVQSIGSREDKIRQQIKANNYDKEAFPPGLSRLKLGFSVLQYDMNEETNAIDLDIWIRMEWHDTRLSWDDSSIEVLMFKPASVWRPDITLYNSLNPTEVENYALTNVLAYPDGRVLWVPPAKASALCFMDMTNWPYDTHNCTLKFGSWTHAEKRINLTHWDPPIEIEDLYETHAVENFHGEWDMLSMEVNRMVKKYECCEDDYVSMNVNMVLKRNSPTYNTIVQGPAVALCLLTVIVFLLPPATGEKTVLAGIALIIDFYFLISVTKIVGHSPNHVPRIVDLISKQLMITTACLVATSCISRLMRVPKGRGLPSCLEGPLMTLAPMLCLRGYKDMVQNSKESDLLPSKAEEVELNAIDTGSTSKDLKQYRGVSHNDSSWMLLGATIDRLCLISFLVVLVINMACFSKVV